MATLVDNPEYTPNEIYAIASTDPVEGYGTGASFSGLGVDNEPHQQLANRTSWLYGQVVSLNNAVAAIQRKLIKSGTIAFATINSGAVLAANANGIVVMTTDFTFPSSSPTGAFCLHAKVGINVQYNAQLPYPVNLGTLQFDVQDTTNTIYALAEQGYLLTSGNEGFGAQVSQDGFFAANYYSPGATIGIAVHAGLRTAAYGFPNLTVGQVILTLTAIPF